MEKRVLIMPFTPLGVQGAEVVCQLENGLVWPIPLQIYEMFSNTLLEEEEEEKKE